MNQTNTNLDPDLIARRLAGVGPTPDGDDSGAELPREEYGMRRLGLTSDGKGDQDSDITALTQERMHLGGSPAAKPMWVRTWQLLRERLHLGQWSPRARRVALAGGGAIVLAVIACVWLGGGSDKPGPQTVEAAPSLSVGALVSEARQRDGWAEDMRELSNWSQREILPLGQHVQQASRAALAGAYETGEELARGVWEYAAKLPKPKPVVAPVAKSPPAAPKPAPAPVVKQPTSVRPRRRVRRRRSFVRESLPGRGQSPPPIEMRLTSIYWRGHVAEARLNGRLVRVGDTVDGAKVTVIKANYIEVGIEGRSYVLRPMAPRPGPSGHPDSLMDEP